MNDKAPIQPEMPPAEPRMWPGKRLRHARENLQMSRDEVARRLHQDIQVIIALEEDDYSRLPGHTYVLGYLRSYARLVRLPVEEIVESVQLERSETATLVPHNINYHKPARLHDTPSRLALYLLLLVLALGLIGWFLFSSESLGLFQAK